MSNNVLTSLDSFFSTGVLVDRIEKIKLGDSLSKASKAYNEEKIKLDLVFKLKPLINLHH